MPELFWITNELNFRLGTTPTVEQPTIVVSKKILPKLHLPDVFLYRSFMFLSFVSKAFQDRVKPHKPKLEFLLLPQLFVL